MNQQNNINPNQGKDVRKGGEVLEHNRNQCPDSEQSLGRKIRKFREQRQVTQSELAEELSVTRQAVSNWEREKTLPDIYMLQRIAAYFEVTLDEFVEGTKEPEVTMPKAPGRLAAATGLAIFCYLLAGKVHNKLYPTGRFPRMRRRHTAVWFQRKYRLHDSPSEPEPFSPPCGYIPLDCYNLQERKNFQS